MQPQGYEKFLDNIQRKRNLIWKSEQEQKRELNYTSQITEPPEEKKASLKYVILHGSEEPILRDGKGALFW